MRIDSIQEYMDLATRTLIDNENAPDQRSKVLNMCLGLSSESGEINEIIKKVFFHGHPQTPQVELHLRKELGDLAWYWVCMCHLTRNNPADILGMNIEKLMARYPDGFDTEKSINRKEGDL